MGISYPDIDPAAFADLTRLVYDRAGIVLRDGKQSLVSGRLHKRLEALNCATWAAYITVLTSPAGENEWVHLLDGLSTNVTSFFRESEHFSMLAELAATQARARQRLRYWCAAASTGEEPYGMAMVLAEILPANIDWKILATDISTRVLEQAKAGRYNSSQVAAIAPERRQRWLHTEGEVAVMAPALRRRVGFARLNLSAPPFPMQGPLDAVFIRNVMIYFDNPGRERVMNTIAPLLAPDARVFVGHTESLAGLAIPFRSVGPAVYALG